MASSIEQMAANASFSHIGKATELKQRLWFTLGVLIVYRLGTYIPVPGIDPRILSDIFAQHSGGLLGVFDAFSGGALGRMTIFALGLLPYISASIIMQLMGSLSPQIAAMKKEGEAGRKKINQYTRYLTVLLCAVQGYGVAVGLEGLAGQAGSAVIDPGLFFRMTTVISIIGGTLFLMWLGEQITQRGIGNGISLIIYAGIVAGLPAALAGTLELGRTGALSTGFIILILILAIALIGIIVFFERAQRRVTIQYPKRMVGQKQYGGEQTHMPMKINTAGVIPPIFASSLLIMPVTIAQFSQVTDDGILSQITAMLGRGQPLFLTIYVIMIVFFAFFYTSVVFNPEETAENLRKNGGFIPGIRPGKNTADYLDYVLSRITVVGAIYLAAVCILPEILIAEYAVPFALGGTSLLIIVSVTMDTVTQIQSHLLAHQYQGLLQKTKLGNKRRK